MFGMSEVSLIHRSLDSRAATFENPTGARGAGGEAHGGRKGSPSHFRTTPRFETGSEKYAWLNRILAVGVGWFEPPNTVAYKVYAIL